MSTDTASPAEASKCTKPRRVFAGPSDGGSWLIGDPDEDKALAKMIWYPFIAATLLLPLGLGSVVWLVAVLAFDAAAWLGFTVWKRRRRRSL